jgi:hypothetical protein
VPLFVYLDESGDSGFKFRQGSTRYFVIALLLVDDPIPIHAAIDGLRRELGFAPNDEFKFNRSAAEIRLAFLRRLNRFDFSVRALVIDKTTMPRPQLGKQETFYNYLVQLILAHDGGTIRDAVLVLDESVQSRRRQDRLGSYLRRALNTDPDTRRVRDIVHHASHTDNLLQAADMVAGAIYAAYHRGDDRYLNIIRQKLGRPPGDLWEWRPGTY